MSEEKGLTITDVTGLSQPLTKLIETVSAGVGKMYEPIHLIRMAKAKAEEIKLIGGAVQCNSLVPTKYEHGDVTIDGMDYTELAQRAENRRLFQRIKRQQNIDSVVRYAANSLESEESVSSEAVDEDWIARFFRLAEDISSDEMQFIWGKILAGEVKQPGTFSLRTLETIKNLSKHDAELFQKVLPFALMDKQKRILYGEDKILRKYGINYSDIVELSEAGLLVLTRVVLELRPKHVLHNTVLVMICQDADHPNYVARANIFPFTTAGAEMICVLQPEFNREYFLDVAEDIYYNSAFRKMTISVHSLVSYNTQEIEYNDEPVKMFNHIEFE